MKDRMRFHLVFAACLVVLALRGPTIANAQVSREFDPLAPLRGALSAAGAGAMTSGQESAINNLIARFRESQTPPAPSSALETARSNYDEAVLKGIESNALAQVDTIAAEMATGMSARMKAQTGFIISVVGVLDAGQLSALVSQFGTSGAVRTIERLAGGPGMGGGPARGRGPMGGGPPPIR